MTKLKAPEGTDEANVGEQRFPVKDDGTVDVPAAAVDALVEVGGFAPVQDTAEAAPEAPEGFAAMRHPDKSGCSFGGENFEPDADGVVHVPHAAVNVLRGHGFEVVE